MFVCCFLRLPQPPPPPLRVNARNGHDKARLRFFSPWGEREGGQKRCIPLAAASGTQTCLVDSGDPRAVSVD